MTVCSQNIHNFWPKARFLPTFKTKSGHGFLIKCCVNTLYFWKKMPFCPLAHFFSYLFIKNEKNIYK
nr:MAG TPA: hypothetical protein [Caudoviricetes sp.]